MVVTKILENSKAPTISDVAREAGVSPYTVSGVLNGARTNTRVSPATRERILASASRLRYQPNAQARNLARKCTKTLGILFDFVRSTEVLTTNYSSAVLQGIVTEASIRGYDVLLYTAETGSDGTLSTARFRDQRTDGIIVVAPLIDDGLMNDLATLRLPLIAVSAAPCYLAEGQVVSVDVNNVQGIDLGVAHLVQLGHRRIAHLSGNANMYSATVRRDAFLAAMAQHGVTADPVVFTCAYDGSLVPEAMEALFALPNPPTALVAGNDNIALAVLEEARRMGIAVPDVLSVVGFDDIAAAAHVTPKLTTVRQPLTDIGATAARLLVERISDNQNVGKGTIDTTYLLAPELIVRSSTAVPFAAPSPSFSVGRRTPETERNNADETNVGA